MTPSRYERGLAKLHEIDGEAGANVIGSLCDIAPDFARYLIEFPFGDIYSRPGLDLRSREIAVVASLTALGNAAPQLKVHIQAALNVGSVRRLSRSTQWTICSERSVRCRRKYSNSKTLISTAFSRHFCSKTSVNIRL
jgi:4-carboxymuconolactone decarboxylase